MPIPQADVDAINAYCQRKTTEFDPTWSVVRADVDGTIVTVTDVEFDHAGKVAVRVLVAQLHYSADDHLWTLHWYDKNGEPHPVDREAATDVRELLDFIDDDPTNIFWG